MDDKKPDLSAFMPPGWEGKLPPCMIQVDKEGQLLHNGAPLVHPGILELIFQSVHLEDGHYILRVDGKACELEVADTFYVVRSLEIDQEGITLLLNDGSKEPLDPNTLSVGPEEVLYCRVKGGEHRARFHRPAYYQLAQMVEPDGSDFVLVLKGHRYPIKG